jgi:hypothetical protein
MDLSQIQKELKVPKDQTNSFGGYNYRSCEDILESVKKILPENAYIVISDKVIEVGGRVYIEATATLHIGDSTYTATGCAREAVSKKGMDDSQITGATSSYARKYALNGLFCIDDTKDADTDEHKATQDNTPAEDLPPSVQWMKDTHAKLVAMNTIKEVNDFADAKSTKSHYDTLSEAQKNKFDEWIAFTRNRIEPQTIAAE